MKILLFLLLTTCTYAQYTVTETETDWEECEVIYEGGLYTEDLRGKIRTICNHEWVESNVIWNNDSTYTSDYPSRWYTDSLAIKYETLKICKICLRKTIFCLTTLKVRHYIKPKKSEWEILNEKAELKDTRIKLIWSNSRCGRV